MKKLLVISFLTLFLVGCASSVKRAPETTSPPVTLSKSHQISSLSISLTEQAQEDLTKNLKFDQNVLLDHIKRALVANQLMDEASTDALNTIDIEVKEIRIRSNFSAVMWGFMAGSDSIKGDVVLKDSAQNEIDRFEISVSYALGGIGGGQDDARMGWLYEKFAEETIKTLTNQK